MNFSLIDKILSIENGFLVSIIDTEGHTYQKRGARALFRSGDVAPVAGNLGSLCADDDIIAGGKEALASGRPQRIEIDTSDPADGQLGYGTACGGKMWVLIEPILESHRTVYRDLATRLRKGEAVTLVRDMETGALSLGEDIGVDARVVEIISPPTRVFFFGATPLSRRLCTLLDDLHVSLHVVDWRPAQLEGLADIPRIERIEGTCALARGDMVVILSHSYERDKTALATAIQADCRYIGMLSSKSRRDGMFAELRGEGHHTSALSRVHSPIGLDIGARTDAEIAVSIAAELVRESGA